MSRLDKRIYDRIDAIMKEQPHITKAQLIDILKAYMPRPDPRDLEEQWWGKKAGDIMSRYRRDEDGDRECYKVTAPEGGSAYVAVSQTNSYDYLGQMAERINRSYEGLRKAKTKIAVRRLILDGQMTIDFGEQEKNAQ